MAKRLTRSAAIICSTRISAGSSPAARYKLKVLFSALSNINNFFYRNIKMDENLIKQFIEDKKANGISKPRLYKYDYMLRNISNLLGKEFKKASLNDVKTLVCKIDDCKYTDSTKYDYKIIVKMFWRWLKKEDNPEEIKWIKPRIKNGKHKLPEELLTQEEVKALIEATSNLKYKLLVSLLYEWGQEFPRY